MTDELRELNDLISRRGLDGTLRDLINYSLRMKRQLSLEADHETANYWDDVAGLLSETLGKLKVLNEKHF